MPTVYYYVDVAYAMWGGYSGETLVLSQSCTVLKGTIELRDCTRVQATQCNIAASLLSIAA